MRKTTPQLVLMFSGQGSQYVGMGKKDPELHSFYHTAEEILGRPFASICFDGKAEDLNLTENTQPAVVTHAAALLERFRKLGIEASIPIVMGHSVGEFAALYAAGVFSFEQMIAIVDVRSRAMQKASPPGSGAMFAILKVDGESLEKLCEEVSKASQTGEEVVCANFNAPGQTVISGKRSSCEKVIQKLERSHQLFRAVELPVSAPFHSPLMRSAADSLLNCLESNALSPTTAAWIANVDAKHYPPGTAPEAVKKLLVEQSYSPVRWHHSVASLPQGCLCLEFGPGKILSGLTKRIRPDLKCLPMDTVQSSEQIQEFFQQESP